MTIVPGGRAAPDGTRDLRSTPIATARSSTPCSLGVRRRRNRPHRRQHAAAPSTSPRPSSLSRTAYSWWRWRERARQGGEEMSDDRDDGGRGRGALRRPLADSRAARSGPQRALVVDRGAAADAAQQPRPRGRRTSRGAGRLRRLAAAPPAATRRCRRSCVRCSGWATTRRCSSRAASRSASSARIAGRLAC